MERDMNEGLKLYGKWKLTAYYKGTKKVAKISEGKNLIVSTGKVLVCNMLRDAAGYDTGLTYCALGSDNTAPGVGQTQLVNEGGGAAMRLPITTKTLAANVLTFSTFFPAASSTLTIEEVAIFGHSTAGGTENSGIMFSRWLESVDNSGAVFDLTFAYELTVG